MGREARCVVRYAGDESEGRAQLETDDLRFRGDFGLRIALASVESAEARDGELHVRFDGDEATFVLGAAAERWARAITSPPSLLDKLDVRDGMAVAVVGDVDGAFRDELAGRARSVEDAGDADAVFVSVEARDDLVQLAQLRRRMRPDAAIWTIRRKGSADVRERDVLEAGRAAGLADVKVARFSATHTAEKFVLRTADRRGG
jgi:hypothetical protein